MKKMLLVASFLFVLVGCGHKTQPTTEKPVEEVKEEIEEMKKEIVKEEIKSNVNNDNVTYKNEKYSFSLVMPKEYSDYIVSTDNMKDGVCENFSFSVPTNDKNWVDASKSNGKNYVVVSSLGVCDLKFWNEKISSPDCKEMSPDCPDISSVVLKNSKNVFTFKSSPEKPDDLISVKDFNLNAVDFNKYFELEVK